MSEFLLVLLATFKVIKFFVGGSFLLFIGFLFIQLISYRVFNFNLYKTIMNTLFKEVR